MADQVVISLEALTVLEGSQLPGAVNFRTRSTGAASTPTTAEYRVYDVENDVSVTDWTSLGTPASRMTFTLNSTDLALNSVESQVNISHSPSYRRQIVIVADRGLSTQALAQKIFRVNSVRGFQT